MSKLILNTLNKAISLSPTTPHVLSFEVDGETINIEVKPYISLQERSDIIDTSCQAAFTESGYSPEYKEAVFKYKIIDTLTNIPTLKSKDTVDLVKYSEAYDKLNLRSKIMDINDYMWDLIINLESMVDEKVDFQKTMMANRDGEIVDAVTGFFDMLNRTVSRYADNLDNIDLQKLAPAIMKLSENKIDKEAIKTILEVGSASKVGSENVTNLEVVK